MEGKFYVGPFTKFTKHPLHSSKCPFHQRKYPTPYNYEVAEISAIYSYADEGDIIVLTHKFPLLIRHL